MGYQTNCKTLFKFSWNQVYSNLVAGFKIIGFCSTQHPNHVHYGPAGLAVLLSNQEPLSGKLNQKWNNTIAGFKIIGFCLNQHLNHVQFVHHDFFWLSGPWCSQSIRHQEPLSIKVSQELDTNSVRFVRKLVLSSAELNPCGYYQEWCQLTPHIGFYWHDFSFLSSHGYYLDHGFPFKHLMGTISTMVFCLSWNFIARQRVVTQFKSIFGVIETTVFP